MSEQREIRALVTDPSSGATTPTSPLSRWLAARWLGIDDETLARYEENLEQDASESRTLSSEG